MYLSFYQLETKPFQISADPSFLWLGEKHREAMAVLKYGVMDNKGFLLLTGEVGTGKTTLINALVNSLGDEVTVATILDPGLERVDFYNTLMAAFGLSGRFSTKGDFVGQFSAFLNETHEQRKKALLIIDEAQRLNPMLLEEIRLLSNIERQSTKLINIFFVGQKEFNSIILDPANRALRQRITVNYDLKPLNRKEIDQYIRHRLKVAGVERTVFRSSAVSEIYRFSKGYPRLINVICDRALLTGYTREEAKISSKTVRECAAELTLKIAKPKSGKAPVPEKVKAPAARKQPSRKDSLGSFVEKGLYLILACMIVAWIVAAAYFYFPKSISHIQQPEEESAGKEIAATPSPSATATEPPGEKSEAPAPQTQPPDGCVPLRQSPTIRDLFPEPGDVLHIDLTDKNELTERGIQTLDRLAAVMVGDPVLSVVVKGYAGEGSDNFRFNKKMSEFTANVVKGFLVGKGVLPDRIETTGIWLVNPEAEGARSPGAGSIWVEIQMNVSSPVERM